MPKIGRNDPCPCGSGKKYKKCCMDKDIEAERQARAKAEEEEFEDEDEDEEIEEEEEDFESDSDSEEYEDWDEPEESPEEKALYEASEEIWELMDKERYEDAARKLLSATENIQDTDVDFDDEIIDIFDGIYKDNPDLATQVVQRAIMLYPEEEGDWQGYIVEGMLEKGDLNSAFSILHKAVEDNPDDMEAWDDLGRSYLKVKDYENAEKYLKHAIEVGKAQRDEDIDEAYIELLDLYIEMGRVEEAMQTWEKAYQYEDDWKSYAPNICGMLIKHGDLERALKYVNWITNSTTRSYYIGKIRHLQGDEKKVRYYWLSVLDGANDADYLIWPEVAFYLKRYDLIIENLEHFLETVPKNENARILISLAYAAKNDMESARKILQESPRKIKLTDEHRSWCKEYLGDEQICNNWMDMFKELYPDTEN